MSQRQFDEMHHEHQWLAAVQSQQSFALSLARISSGEFADLLFSETKKYTDQPGPQSPDELALRQRQAGALTFKASALVHAGLLAKAVPGAASAIQAAARTFSATALPRTEAEFRQAEQAVLEFMAHLTKLCAADWSPQI